MTAPRLSATAWAGVALAFVLGGCAAFGGGESAGGDDATRAAEAGGLGVNPLLWRASLETLSFMPLRETARADGVISTAWHAQPADANERFRLDVHVRSQELRADGIKVSLFRQVRDGSDGQWQQAEVSPETEQGLEEAIIAQARELRLRQRNKTTAND